MKKVLKGFLTVVVLVAVAVAIMAIVVNQQQEHELAVAKARANEACQQAWLNYRLEEAKAENIRVTEGQLAYLDAKEKLVDDKPICTVEP